MIPNVKGRAYRSAWKSHKEEWSNCTKCPLHEFSHHRVLVSGTLPCNILFIGDAPNRIEDVAGLPFLGPRASIIHQMIKDVTVEFTYAMTNLIGCVAFDKDEVCRPPADSEVDSCKGRVSDTLMMAKPLGIVALETDMEDYLDTILKSYKFPYALLHLFPLASILSQGGIGCDTYRIESDRLNNFIEEVVK